MLRRADALSMTCSGERMLRIAPRGRLSRLAAHLRLDDVAWAYLLSGQMLRFGSQWSVSRAGLLEAR
jgi:hypothetical protein